jgi:U2 small nuclear ribonucleoprotein A'
MRSNRSGRPGAAATANGTSQGGKFKVTEEEKKRFQILVQKAKTLSEVQRLEKMFNEGRLPPGLGDDEAMDET